MKKCYECTELVPCYRDNGILMSRGVCTLVGDYPSFVGRNENCVWKISGVNQLSEREIAERNEQYKKSHLEFVASLERASKIVESWPEWKRVLG